MRMEYWNVGRMEYWNFGKMEFWVAGVLILFLGMSAEAQHECTDPNCTSCEASVEPVVESHDDHDHGQTGISAPRDEQTFLSAHPEHDEHEGHDPAAEEVKHDEPDDHAAEEVKYDEHEGHDHAAEEAKHDEHEGCARVAEEAALDDHAAESHEEHGELEIETVSGGVVERMASFPAEIQINRDRAAAVSPKYAGTVREIYVEIGDSVKEGDILATIESRETLANYPVKAPLAGVVVSRGSSVGELAGEEADLFEIVDLSSVWVEVHVFPQHRHAVRKGQAVHLMASDGHEVETELNYVSPLIDPETRTVKARCVLVGGGDDFSPGAFVRAQIAVESVQARVRVEKEAVQTMNGETIVFIEDEHGVEPRDVQVGISGGDFVEIESGLEPGEKVVTHGAFDLKAELVTSGLDPHAGHGH